jgi:hypothetical protein
MTMRRRSFLICSAAALLSVFPAVAHAGDRKFIFKIKTKSGGIIGNIVIEAKNSEAAKHILRERYPGCEILDMEEK